MHLRDGAFFRRCRVSPYELDDHTAAAAAAGGNPIYAAAREEKGRRLARQAAHHTIDPIYDTLFLG